MRSDKQIQASKTNRALSNAFTDERQPRTASQVLLVETMAVTCRRQLRVRLAKPGKRKIFHCETNPAKD